MDAKRAKKVGILVITGIVEMGVMIRDVLRELGFDAWTENEKRWDEVDVVILPSDSVGLELLPGLGQPGVRRPVTILWLVDPLPPPGLSARAEAIGLGIAKMDWRRLLPGRWGEVVSKYVPFGREVLRLGRWIWIRNLRKEIAQNGQVDYLRCDEREWDRVMVRYYHLREYMRNGCIDYLFTTTEAKRRFLVERACDVEFVPFGYHPCFGEYHGVERDIDVVFLGRLNNRRRKVLLHDLSEELTTQGVELRIIDKDCYGDERTELLNRTKISIDLPRAPWDFAIERFLISMSCGALLVSEGKESRQPFRAGVHFVQTQACDMAHTIFRYLRNERERAQISMAAYEFVSKEITLKKSVTQLLIKCGLLDAE